MQHALTHPVRVYYARGQKTPARGGPFPKALDKATLSEKRGWPSTVSHSLLPHEGPLTAAKFSFLDFKLFPQHLLLVHYRHCRFVDYLREEEPCHQLGKIHVAP